jgi:hypothetical protein
MIHPICFVSFCLLVCLFVRRIIVRLIQNIENKRRLLYRTSSIKSKDVVEDLWMLISLDDTTLSLWKKRRKRRKLMSDGTVVKMQILMLSRICDSYFITSILPLFIFNV